MPCSIRSPGHCGLPTPSYSGRAQAGCRCLAPGRRTADHSRPCRWIGQSEDSYREEVVELLNWVGLGDRISALPPVLSGGEKQRAAIARAVIARPQLLLADEPTGNVDPNLAKRLLRLFVELNKSGTSVIIATHDIALMDQFDARRLVLHHGGLYVYD